MKSIGMRGAAFIFVLCVLVLSHSLFWGQTVKLTAMFDKTKGEAVLQYHIDGNNELLEKKVRINKEKAADFRIDDGVITDFGFVTEDDVRLEAVKIKGRENLRIEPATEELYHLKIYGKRGITNWFALFFLVGFAYYMFYWMISVLLIMLLKSRGAVF